MKEDEPIYIYVSIVMKKVALFQDVCLCVPELDTKGLHFDEQVLQVQIIHTHNIETQILKTQDINVDI
jgi:hypothetical protein